MINNKEKHIFLIFFHLGVGGVQRKIVDIVNYVYDQEIVGIVPHIIIRDKTSFSMESELPNQYKYLHCRPTFLNNRIRVPFPIYICYLMFVIKPESVLPSLYFSTFYTVIAVKILFWRKINIVVNQDNVFSHENKSIFSRILAKLSYNFVNKIIVQTKYAKKDLIDYLFIKEEKISVIPNWTKTKPIKRKKKIFDLIYMGRFSEQKNLLSLLRIVKLVKRNRDNISLALFGEGSELNRIKYFIKDNNLHKNIKIYSPVNDPINKLLSAKILCLTSIYEGHPLILLEAMSLGVVPVILKYPGVNEYIINRKTGFIEKDENDMATRIISLLDSNQELKKVGIEARKEIKNSYSSKLIYNYLDLL